MKRHWSLVNLVKCEVLLKDLHGTSVLSYSQCKQKPEVSDETGALLVYSCFITYKSFSHKNKTNHPISIEHAELLGM